MHIGFDISQTGADKAGCGFFAHSLVKALMTIAPENRYSLYPSFGDFYLDSRMPIKNPYQGPQVSYGPGFSTKEAAGAFWNRHDLENALASPDIVHSNNFWAPTKLARSRLIYTLYDLGFVEHPEWTTEANRVGCFEGVFRSAVAADYVIAISEFSRRSYLDLFPHFPEDRLRVVYPCSRFADVQEGGRKPRLFESSNIDKFWLSVGTIEPRKNHRMLVDAYAKYLGSGGEPIPLVLAGGQGWLMEDFHMYVGSLGLDDKVLLLGYVTDNELIWLYRNCFANLYPSLYEGFGLPVLEGMQFGAPTIASNIASIREIAGDATIQLAVDRPDEWVNALHSLASNNDQRRALALAGYERAKQFSWQESAKGILRIYQEAAQAAKRELYQRKSAVLSASPRSSP